jgi:hypothetical protein
VVKGMKSNTAKFLEEAVPHDGPLNLKKQEKMV